MKKTNILLLSFLTACSLAACGIQEQAAESKAPESLAENFADTERTETGEVENDGEAEGYSEAEPEESSEQQSVHDSAESTGNSSILIVYFSRYGNMEYPDDVDATTSASIVADESGRYGTTEYVANMIQQAAGGDVHRIETVTPYTEAFDELRDVNHEEMDHDFLP